MRFSWRKPKGKGRKAKEPADIRALAKEIVASRMKKDPEFGLEISMRELRYEKGEEPEQGEFTEHRPFKEYMKDVRDMREFMNEFREESKGGAAWVEIAKTFAQSIGQGLAQNLSPMLQNMMRQQQSAPLELEETPVKQLEKTPSVTLTAPPKAKLSELMTYLEDSPEKAVQDLEAQINEGNSQAFIWANLIKGRSYEELVALLEPFKASPDYAEAIGKLLDQDEGEWFRKFVELVQKIQL